MSSDYAANSAIAMHTAAGPGSVQDMSGHVPVMLDETLDLLQPEPGDVYVDCTAGRGGHAAAFAERVGPTGHVVLFDLDEENLQIAHQRVADLGVPVTTFHGSFAGIGRCMGEFISGGGRAANVVLADLGFSSTQVDDPDRGFSFRHDGPLDMRLDRTSPVTAADLVARMSEAELAEIIKRDGEEPLARRIARKIALQRAQEPIRTTGALAELVREAYGGRAHQSRLHPATRTFQALRMAVNDEVAALASLLQSIASACDGLQERGTTGNPSRSSWLAPGARVGVMSFHSLEDRAVKQSFVRLDAAGVARRRTRKPVIAGDAEQSSNPRARSAKLRVLEVTGTSPSDGQAAPPTA